MSEGGIIDVVLAVPDSKHVDDIRDPYLRAMTADALDTGTDPQAMLRLEAALVNLGAHKAAAAVGKKARQMRVAEDRAQTERKIVVDLLGDKVVAEEIKRIVLP